MKKADIILRIIAICACLIIFYSHHQRFKNFIRKSPENFNKQKSSIDFVNDTVLW